MIYVGVSWTWLLGAQSQGAMSALSSKKYSMLRGIYLFWGIYTNDMSHTGLSGRFGMEKMGQLAFEVKGNLPGIT